MVDKGTRGGICHSIYQHAKASNKYIKGCDKNKKNVISPMLGYKLFIWLGNVAKTSSK